LRLAAAQMAASTGVSLVKLSAVNNLFSEKYAFG
jgi:hypothetical protein